MENRAQVIRTRPLDRLWREEVVDGTLNGRAQLLDTIDHPGEVLQDQLPRKVGEVGVEGSQIMAEAAAHIYKNHLAGIGGAKSLFSREEFKPLLASLEAGKGHHAIEGLLLDGVGLQPLKVRPLIAHRKLEGPGLDIGRVLVAMLLEVLGELGQDLGMDGAGGK